MRKERTLDELGALLGRRLRSGFRPPAVCAFEQTGRTFAGTLA
jgi:hypothetical protein